MMNENYVGPSEENFASFGSHPEDHLIHMLNFLKYRKTADYPEGHEHAGKGWSGRRAYEEYLKAIEPIFERIGAKIIWKSAFQATTIGSPDEVWDDMLTAEYPNSQVFLAMVSDPEYQAAGVNRTAALTDSRLFRTNPKGAS